MKDLRVGQEAPIIARAQSIFDRLPYDIRAIIYSYLEPGELPPLTLGFLSSTSGFILSCRRAKQDLQDIASAQFAKYIAEFKASFDKSTDLQIQIDAIAVSSTLDQLRHITVSLPFASFGSFDPLKKVLWKRPVLLALHPLFAQFYDKVHVHFVDEGCAPAHETLIDRGRVEVAMHSLLRDITYMIARVNREKADGPQSNTTVYVEEIFNCKADRQNGAYSSARVNTKRICLSWDLREEAHNMKSVVMNGKTYRDLRLGVDVGNGARSPPIFYHLRDSQRLAGEMGVVSATRWELAGYLSLNKLLNGVGTCAEYCCSDGFGKVMRDGLHGVVEDDFEASELEVSELIYN